jgi:hypothetical protein
MSRAGSTATPPITAQHARDLAADPTGTWRRLLTDPIFGQVIDYGTTRYRPPRPGIHQPPTRTLVHAERRLSDGLQPAAEKQTS